MLTHDEQRKETIDHAWSSVFNTRFDAASCTLSDLDAELEAVKKYHTLARQKRNALTSVCKLPVELQSKIFRIVRDDWELKDDGPRRGKPRNGLGWIFLSHVCSSWRKVAISDPVLWRTIDCLKIHPSAIHTILHRAGKQGLRMTLNLSDCSPSTLSSALQTWLNPLMCRRTELLKVSSTGSTVLDSLPRHMPHLKTLSLKYSFPRGTEPFPHQFLTEEMPYPNLTHLTLSNVPILWRSTLFTSTLTRLDWSLAYGWDPSTYLESTDFPRLLAQMPNLESLTLDKVFEEALDGGDAVAPRYPLPSCFRFLNLRFLCGDTCAAGMLDMVHIPAATTVIVELYSINSASSIGRIAAALFQGAFAEEPEPRELMVDKSWFYVRPWSATCPAPAAILKYTRGTSSGTYEPRSRCLVFEDDSEDPYVDSEDEDDTRALADARRYLPYIPFASITAVTICRDLEYGLEPRTPNFWFGTFCVARNVLHLQVPLTRTIEDLCSALEWSVKSDFLIFPRLEVIILGFSARSRKNKALNGADQTCVVLALESALRKREEGGAPVREVRVTEDARLWEGDPWIGVRELVQLNFFE
ncbi:unnamed protein product [Peniophora sp. CBMAI 1063]|nr:unnamed protein product [Peniophora sp. CBMAI 1063]